MNLQNIPRDNKIVKECFVPKHDAFLFFDYKNIEIRLLAFYLSAALGDDEMAQQFRDDPQYDPHRETAQKIFYKDEITDLERQAGKTLNFSVIYGGGTPTIMRQLGVSYAEAKKMLLEFHKARPGITAMNAELGIVLDSRGFVKNFYGRHGHVTEKHKVLNWLIQSTAADIMKDAIISVHEYLQGPPWGPFDSQMVNTIHDEIMMDCVSNEIYQLSQDVPYLMRPENDIQKIVPITVDVEIGLESWAYKKEYEDEFGYEDYDAPGGEYPEDKY